MADLQYTVGVETSQAQRNLQALSDRVTSLTSKFDSLRSAVAGIGFAAALTNAMRFADAIQDISDATGIAVSDVLAFNEAVSANGGDSEKAQQGLLKFVQTIGEAADGGKKAQLAFEEVGVSLQDIATLSQKDLLAKTLTGLNRIDDSSKRLGLTVELLGKNFRAVGVQNLGASFQQASQDSRQYASAITQAADAQNKLDKTIRDFQIAILTVSKPLLDMVASIDISTKAMVRFFEVLGEAVKFAAIVASILAIGRAFMVLKTAVVAAIAVVRELNTSFRGLLRALSDPLTRSNLIKSLEELPGIGSKAKVMVEAMGVPLQWLKTNFDKLAIGIAAAIGAMREWLGLGKDDAGTIPGTDRTTRYSPEETARMAAYADEQKRLREEADRVTSAWDKQAKAIRQASLDFSNQNKLTIDSINLQAQLVGKTEDYGQIIQAQEEIYRRAAQESEKLARARDQLGKEDEKLIPIYNEQIAKIKEVAEADAQRVARALTNLQGLNTVERLRQFTLDQQLQTETQLASIYNEIATMHLPEMERRYKSIELAAKAAAEAQIRSEQIRLGRELNPEEQKKYYDAAQNGVGRLQAAQGELLQQQEKLNVRTFQMQQQNRLQQEMNNLQDQLNTMTMTELEKKYYNIDAASRNIAQNEIAAAEARLGRKLTKEEEKQYYDAASAGSDKLKEKTKELYEESRKFSTGWKQAFNEYIENATNAAEQARQSFNAFTSNLESAIDNWVDTGKFKFSDFATSVIKDLLKIQMKAATMELFKYMNFGGGSLLGSLGSLLGFAQGGNPPIGRASIVGENGPELIVPRTATTVIPNHQLGGGVTNNTYVTNNISAIDAKSVAQLFAENRRLLLGNVEQAKKEMPYGMGMA